MSRLVIDFAPRSLRSLWYRLPRGATLLLLLALLVMVAAGAQMAWVQQQSEVAKQVLERRLARDRKPLERSPAVAAPTINPAQANAANSAIKKLNIPWTELLDALEAAASPKVALLELRPDSVTRQLVAVAETGSSDAMFAYLRQLRRQPLLAAVHLSSHQVNEQDRNKPIRFEFSATWRELGP